MAFRYRRILLVGATSGIGTAMADKLISECARVTAMVRRQDWLDAFVNKHSPENVRPRSSLGFRWVSEVEAAVIRAVQYVLLYEETERWPCRGR
jgi:NAD(P)-dependent dehydrogenase (short-subunit alcohol dehydrogenase family)